MKKAILCVSFGVVDQKSRKKNIQACEIKLRKAFSDHDFYTAFTSKRIIQKIQTLEGTAIPHLKDVLEIIALKNYDQILIQPLFIVPGEEATAIKTIAAAILSPEKTKIAQPLLKTMKDAQNFIQEYTKTLPALPPHAHYVLVGHGTANQAHQLFKTLDKALSAQQIPAALGTLQDPSRFDEISSRLKENAITHVVLIPFLLTIGHHVQQDLMAWLNKFEAQGFKGRIEAVGLGELELVQEIFVKHAQRAQKGEH